MDSYNIVILQPEGYPHSMAFFEMGKLLCHSFQSLGKPVQFKVNTFASNATNVILGYNLVSDPAVLAPHPHVIVQLEQLSEKEGWYDEKRHAVLAGAKEIWDYSQENIEFLKARGLDKVKHLPIGFHEQLRTIQDAPEQDVDVLFYGCVNDRRKLILDEFRKHCKVASLFGVYGEQRDPWIGRAKIVLNVHFYEAQVMEQVRISYLLNNCRFVLSEDAPANPYRDFLESVPYDQLVDRCLWFLDHPKERDACAGQGYDEFRKRSMTVYLKRVVNGPGTRLAGGGDN